MVVSIKLNSHFCTLLAGFCQLEILWHLAINIVFKKKYSLFILPTRLVEINVNVIYIHDYL